MIFVGWRACTSSAANTTGVGRRDGDAARNRRVCLWLAGSAQLLQLSVSPNIITSVVTQFSRLQCWTYNGTGIRVTLRQLKLYPGTEVSGSALVSRVNSFRSSDGISRFNVLSRFSSSLLVHSRLPASHRSRYPEHVQCRHRRLLSTFQSLAIVVRPIGLLYVPIRLPRRATPSTSSFFRRHPPMYCPLSTQCSEPSKGQADQV